MLSLMVLLGVLVYFFFNDTATTEIYTYGHTLSLHDALPICRRHPRGAGRRESRDRARPGLLHPHRPWRRRAAFRSAEAASPRSRARQAAAAAGRRGDAEDWPQSQIRSHRAAPGRRRRGPL